MSVNLPHSLSDTLLWSDELGIGWHPRQPMEYRGEYFQKYRRMDREPMGVALTAARVEMVRRHTQRTPVDIGIGGGRFVESINGLGYDVNAEAVAWLHGEGRYLDVYQHPVDAITCWDSLEHVPEPEKLVACALEWVFVAMPIYRDQADCLASKHYRPGEHIWYWTHDGLVQWFQSNGFELVEYNDTETMLGREGIMSYAFKRVEK